MVEDICYYAIGDDLYIVMNGKHERIATCISPAIAKSLASGMNDGLDAISDFKRLRNDGII